MVHANFFRLALVTALALLSLGAGRGAAGQTASPAAGTPGSEREARFSAAERAYLEAMTPIVTTVHDSLGRYEALARDPQLLNPLWLAKVGFEAMLWRSANEHARSLTPPPAFAASHVRFLEALGLLAQSADDASAAGNAGDLVGLLQIGTKIANATQLFDQATAQMATVVAARGGAEPAASPAVGAPDSAPTAAPAPATAVAGQVNVIVEVNTFVGLGSLSTGTHAISVAATPACPAAGDAP